MAEFRLSVGTRNALLAEYRGQIDAGAGPGLLEIYEGAVPANPDAPPVGTLLAVLTFSKPCAPDPIGGLLTFSDITEDAEANASGIAGWARATDSGGGVVFVCDVGAGGSGAVIELNTTQVVAGGPVRITAFTLAQPVA